MTVINEPTNLFKEVGELGRRPDLLNYIIEERIGKRIKKDYSAKTVAFLTGVSAYTKEPLNNDISELSGAGKTHNATNSLIFFPPEDVWALGGLSPTAIYHEYGVMIDKDGNEIDLGDAPNKEEFKEKFKDPKEFRLEFNEAARNWRRIRMGSKQLIDMSNKILVFLQTPSEETISMMYAILSHDKEEVEFKITNPKTHHVDKIVVRGWPAVIFCCTREKWLEELSTRSLMTSPDTDPDKILKAQEFSAEMSSEPWLKGEWLDEERVITDFLKTLKSYMKNISGVVGPYDKGLPSFYPHELRRDMRDFNHFKTIRDTITVLYFMQRPTMEYKGKTYLVSTITDLVNTQRIFEGIIESTRRGITTHLLTFFHEVLETHSTWETSEISDAYNKKYPDDPRSSDVLRNWMKTLSYAGLLDIKPNPDDRRGYLYFPIAKKTDIARFSETRLLSIPDLEKAFKEWSDRYKRETKFRCNENSEITMEELHQKIFVVEPQSLLGYLSKTESEREPQMELESTRKEEIRVKSGFPEDFFGGGICEICGERVDSLFKVEAGGKPLMLCLKCKGEIGGI